MNRTPTNNYFIILIADGTIYCCTRHVRDRQLQIFVTRPTLVSEPRHISFLLSTRNAPATLGSQIPPSDATSGRDARACPHPLLLCRGLTRIRVSVTVEAIPALLHIPVSSSWRASSFPSSQSTTPSRTSPSPRQPSAPLCTQPSR
jgi:hypothetical protein